MEIAVVKWYLLPHSLPSIAQYCPQQERIAVNAIECGDNKELDGEKWRKKKEEINTADSLQTVVTLVFFPLRPINRKKERL